MSTPTITGRDGQGNAIIRWDSSERPALATGGTIPTSAAVVHVSPSGAVTGAILAAGTFDRQPLTLVNLSANSITFAAAGTSNVADGVSDVVAALTARAFVWEAATGRWYRLG